MDIIVDIDGTIADMRHRRHFLDPDKNNGKKDWKSFFGSMMQDTPIVPVLEIVKYFSRNADNNIIFCTGRPSNYELHTRDWLYLHAGFDDPILYMRDHRDCRPDFVVKEYMLSKMREIDYDPELALEDKQECVDMWRRNGIICLQNSMKELP